MGDLKPHAAVINGLRTTLMLTESEGHDRGLKLEVATAAGLDAGAAGKAVDADGTTVAGAANKARPSVAGK